MYIKRTTNVHCTYIKHIDIQEKSFSFAHHIERRRNNLKVTLKIHALF